MGCKQPFPPESFDSGGSCSMPASQGELVYPLQPGPEGCYPSWCCALSYRVQRGVHSPAYTPAGCVCPPQFVLPLGEALGLRG